MLLVLVDFLCSIFDPFKQQDGKRSSNGFLFLLSVSTFKVEKGLTFDEIAKNQACQTLEFEEPVEQKNAQIY